MMMQSARLALGGAAILVACALGPAVQAQDFFSLFGGFGVRRPPAPMMPFPFASERSGQTAPDGDLQHVHLEQERGDADGDHDGGHRPSR